jgi:hypothetical protein
MLWKNEISYMKWVAWFGSFTFSLLAATCLFNFAVDDVGVFHVSNDLLFAAKSLTQGQIVAGFRNIDDRRLQQLIIENDKRRIDTIILGSSRSMELRSRMFDGGDKGKGFFNHSVSSASLEDYIAIIGLYKGVRKCIPGKVIIGVDPWIFNKDSELNLWQSISAFYESVVSEMYGRETKSKAASSVVKYRQLITWDYTIANMNSVLAPSGRKRFYIVSSIDTDDYLREPDGSLHYPYKFRFRENSEVEKEAGAFYTNSPVYSRVKFHSLSNTQLFEDFIGYLREHGVEVILFLPPYHPLTYGLLANKDEYKVIKEVEKYLRSYALCHGIKLLGSYDPQRCKLKGADFFDGMHLRDTGAKTLLAN